MIEEKELREKLRKIERLFAGAGTDGERGAAAAAIGRIKEKLATARKSAKPVEMKFLLNDQWSRQLFITLCRRYELQPYRRPRQRRTTVMLKVPELFVNEVLWPEYQELNTVLTDYLAQTTERIISEEIFNDVSDASEVGDLQQLA